MPTQLTAHNTHPPALNPASLALSQDSGDAQSRLETNLGGFLVVLPVAGENVWLRDVEKVGGYLESVKDFGFPWKALRSLLKTVTLSISR